MLVGHDYKHIKQEYNYANKYTNILLKAVFTNKGLISPQSMLAVI